MEPRSDARSAAMLSEVTAGVRLIVIRRSSERAGAALGHAAGSVDWRSVSIATTALTHAASNGDTTGCHHAALTASLSLGVVRVVCVSWRRRYAALSSGAMLRVA